MPSRAPSWPLLACAGALLGVATGAAGAVPASAPAQPAAAASPVRHIVVFPVHVAGGISARQGELLDEILLTELSALVPRGVKVIGSSDVTAMLGLEQQKQMLACDDAACLADIGNALGASHLLVSKVGALGSRFVITTKFLDVSDSSVAFREVVYVPASEDALVTGMRRIHRALARAQGWLDQPTAATVSSPGAVADVAATAATGRYEGGTLNIPEAGLSIRLPAGFGFETRRVLGQQRYVILVPDVADLEFHVDVGHDLVPLELMRRKVDKVVTAQLQGRGGFSARRLLERSIAGRPSLGLAYDGLDGPGGAKTSLYLFLVKDGIRRVAFVFSVSGDARKPAFAACDRIFEGVIFHAPLPPPSADLASAFGRASEPVDGQPAVEPSTGPRHELPGTGVSLQIPTGFLATPGRDALGNPVATVTSGQFPGFRLLVRAAPSSLPPDHAAGRLANQFAALLDEAGGFEQRLEFKRKVGDRQAFGFGFEGTRHQGTGMPQAQHGFVTRHGSHNVLFLASAPQGNAERMKKTFAQLLDGVRFGSAAQGPVSKVKGRYCVAGHTFFSVLQFDGKGGLREYTEASGYHSIVQSLSLAEDELSAQGSYDVRGKVVQLRFVDREQGCTLASARTGSLLRCDDMTYQAGACE